MADGAHGPGSGPCGRLGRASSCLQRDSSSRPPTFDRGESLGCGDGPSVATAQVSWSGLWSLWERLPSSPRHGQGQAGFRPLIGMGYDRMPAMAPQVMTQRPEFDRAAPRVNRVGFILPLAWQVKHCSCLRRVRYDRSAAAAGRMATSTGVVCPALVIRREGSHPAWTMAAHAILTGLRRVWGIAGPPLPRPVTGGAAIARPALCWPGRA